MMVVGNTAADGLAEHGHEAAVIEGEQLPTKGEMAHYYLVSAEVFFAESTEFAHGIKTGIIVIDEEKFIGTIIIFDNVTQAGSGGFGDVEEYQGIVLHGLILNIKF